MKEISVAVLFAALMGAAGCSNHGFVLGRSTTKRSAAIGSVENLNPEDHSCDMNLMLDNGSHQRFHARGDEYKSCALHPGSIVIVVTDNYNRVFTILNDDE